MGQHHVLDIIHPTPLVPLTSIMSLPQFSFDLIFVNKLTHTLNCSISFFPDYRLFHYLLMRRIIGRRHEFGDLYILDPKVPMTIACSKVATPFEVHCCLGHLSLSLSLLKKLYHQFFSLPLLDYEVC